MNGVVLSILACFSLLCADGAEGLRKKTAFSVWYWFLISGPRNKHLSVLYIVPVKLEILFDTPFANLKVNYVQIRILTEVWLTTNLFQIPMLPQTHSRQRRDWLRENERERISC